MRGKWKKKNVASEASALVVKTDRTHLESTFSPPKPPTAAPWQQRSPSTKVMQVSGRSWRWEVGGLPLRCSPRAGGPGPSTLEDPAGRMSGPIAPTPPRRPPGRPAPACGWLWKVTRCPGCLVPGCVARPSRAKMSYATARGDPLPYLEHPLRRRCRSRPAAAASAGPPRRSPRGRRPRPRVSATGCP